MSIPTYPDLVRRFGLAFRPDLPAFAYGEHPNAHRDPPSREVHDAVVRAAFAEHEAGAPLDPYDAALAVWQEDGLLGTGDPGPPAFRDAHHAYVVAQTLVKMSARHGTIAVRRAMREEADDIPEATESDFARARLSYPRPRIHPHALLAEVEKYNHDVMRAVHYFTGDVQESEFALALENLVAWFAERGVEVES